MKKGRVGRKLTAWLLSTAMAVGGLALGGVGTENVAAEEKKTVAGLSTSAIKGPETTATYNSQGRKNNWKGSYVWFGKYDGQPVKYRVLSTKTTEYGGTTMFLDCENILYQIAFDKDCKPNAGQAYANWWHGSDLDRSLNGSDFLWNDDCFTQVERCALRGSTIASHSRSLDTAASNCCYSSINDFADFTALTGELIFVLDVGELIPKYGYFFPQKDAVNGEHWMWWTRSAHKLISEHYATSVGYVPNYVYSHGNVDGTGYSRPLGASPAFNVDLNSVIFSSVVSGTAGENDAEYKLTVLDELMGTEFVATNGVVSSALVGATKTDVSMRLCLTGENAENATQLSVLILDKEYQSGNSNGAKILYYDKMVVPEGMGNVEATKTALFTLPVGLKVEDWGTKYYVYVLAEDVNGKFETDYASAPHLMSKPKVSYAFPSIKAQPVGKTVPVGDIAVFTVAAQGTGTLHFQWQSRKDSTSRWSNSGQPGAKTSKLEVTALAGLHGWQFRCVITDDKGTIYSNPATLKVVPKITQQPKNATVPVSDIATFTVAATGKGPLKYQWQSRKDASTAWSNSGMPGAKTATLEVTVLAGLHGWQFRCVVTDANGMSWGSNPATLKVVPKITKQPKNTTAKAGSVATFTVAATGKGPLTYQWQSRKNASSAWSNSGQPGAKTATLEVTALAGLHGWQFRCVVTDANGMSWGSNPATLTVTK